MVFDPEFLKQLAETFKVELEERLQIITDGLLALEKNNLPKAEAINVVESIFRASHNIKGSAYGIGVDDVGKIAHAMESLFSAVKNESISIDVPLINLSLKAIDAMRLTMQAFLSQSRTSFSLDDLLEQLETATLPKTAASNSKDKLPKKRLKNTAKAKQPTKQPLSNENQKKQSIAEEKLVDSLEHEKHPPPQPEKDKIIHVSLLHLDQISALMEKMQIIKIAIEEQYQVLYKLTEKINRFNGIWAHYNQSFMKNSTQQSAGIISQFYDTGDIALNEVNKLSYELNKNMRIQVNELSMTANSLQNEIRMLRLIPANTLMKNMLRYVRDMAIELGKQVDFKVTGDEAKLDKIILEGLQDPLTHLIRNALDHGIESPDMRIKKGKSPVGKLNIDICEEGDHILFKIEDDGEGIDVNKIGKIALSQNLISKSELENMNENAILNLVFRPGFSTKENVTSISGRGVGLDVVKNNIENLKGEVWVTTQLNTKTTFLLKVPLTLSSEQGLLVQCLNQEFVIPVNAIERVLMLERKDIVEVEASQAILLDNHPVHLMLLSDILQLEKQETLFSEKLAIIVLKKGSLVIALVVDGVIGDREIVIKPLQPPLMSVPCVSGGTLSGSGKVIIVLSPDDIVNRAFHIVNSSHITPTSSNKATKNSRPHILVVDDSITTRSLEKNILESNDYQVSVAADGRQAWEMLQKQAFSLLISDVMMPEMDGITLTQNVRKSQKLRDLPIILVTSLGAEEEKMRGLEAGANYYIVKNEFESGGLLEIVGQLL